MYGKQFRTGVPMKRFSWQTVVPVTEQLAVIVFLLILGMLSARAWAGDNVWTSIGPAGTWVSGFVVDPQNPSTVYAGLSFGESAGIFKTTDGGASWNRLAGFPAGSSPLAIDSQNPSTLYAARISESQNLAKSVNGGATWDVIGSLYPNWITDLVIDPRNTNTLYAVSVGFECGEAATLHKSVNGGVSWMSIGFRSLGVSANCDADLAIDPQNSATLYAAFADGGVFKSTDAGASWTAVNSGLSIDGYVPSAVSLSIDPLNPSTLYAVARAYFPGTFNWTVFKSSDGGNSWHAANSGLPSWSSSWDCCYRPRLAVDPQSPNRVYLGAAVEGVHCVFMSADGGATWLDSGFAMPSGSLWFGGLAVGPQGGPGTVYAGTPAQGVFAITFPPLGRRERLIQIRSRHLATQP